MRLFKIIFWEFFFILFSDLIKFRFKKYNFYIKLKFFIIYTIDFLRYDLVTTSFKFKLIRKFISDNCKPIDKNILFVENYAIAKNKNDNGIAYCFGLHDDILYEKKLSNDFNMDVYMYDPSPISIKKYNNINLKYNNIHFFPYALWTIDKKMKFFYQSDEYDLENMSGSLLEEFSDSEKYIEVECLSLKSMMKKNSHKKIDLLKMDIEGAGQQILENIFENNYDKFINQITLEIELVTDPNKLNLQIKKLSALFTKIKQNHKIHYIPRSKRFRSLELLIVKN